MHHYSLQFRRSLAFFTAASLFMGFYSGLYDPSFNNYLDQVHHVSAQVRGGLEFPRELPGFLVVFIFTALSFMADTRLAALSAFMVGIALLGQAYLSPGVPAVVLWMLVWSTGAHLYMGLSHAIALRLAAAGDEGRFLGRIGAIESLGALAGMAVVYGIARAYTFDFASIFALAGLLALLSAALLWAVKPAQILPTRQKLVFKSRYRLYYLLNILFGARKQIFITFAPWLLIQYFGCGVASFAALGFAGTIASLFFRPALGQAIDYWGERIIIMWESGLLIIMCLAYGLAPLYANQSLALMIIMACYVLDQMLFAVRIARSTYLNRIAERTEDIPATISMGLTLDHAVSMLIPFAAGFIWAQFHYIYVFIAAALIALLNLMAARLIPPSGRRYTCP